MKISGFTFIHNGIEGGYPFVQAIQAVSSWCDEMVVVDMQSTDGTRSVLEQLPVRILEGVWIPGTGGACLAENHLLHNECRNDIIWHCEADEVFDIKLCMEVMRVLESGEWNTGTLNAGIAVHRLQVEQNFQRCRWYPEPVHRIFQKGMTTKVGHTTNQHHAKSDCVYTIDPMYGFLWDVTNCFRDNWKQRNTNQAELWGDDRPRHRYVPYHFTIHTNELTEEECAPYLQKDLWIWECSPFALPDSLEVLVGMVDYRGWLECQQLI